MIVREKNSRKTKTTDNDDDDDKDNRDLASSSTDLKQPERGKDKRKRKFQSFTETLRNSQVKDATSGLSPRGRSSGFGVGKSELRPSETKFGSLRFHGNAHPVVNAHETLHPVDPRGFNHVGHVSQRITPNPLVQYPLFEDQTSDELHREYNWVFGLPETPTSSQIQRGVDESNEVPTKDTITARIRGPDKKKRKARTCKTCLPDCSQKQKCPGRYPRGKHLCSCTSE